MFTTCLLGEFSISCHLTCHSKSHWTELSDMATLTARRGVNVIFKVSIHVLSQKYLLSKNREKI